MNKYHVHYAGLPVQVIEADCYSVSAEGSTHFYRTVSDKTKELVASVLSAAQPVMIMKQGTGGRGWVPWSNPAHYTVKFLPGDITKLRSMKGSNGEVPWAPAITTDGLDTFLGRDIVPEGSWYESGGIEVKGTEAEDRQVIIRYLGAHGELLTKTMRLPGNTGPDYHIDLTAYTKLSSLSSWPAKG